MFRLRLLSVLAMLGLAMSMGQGYAWEGPLEKAIEDREEDRTEAAAQGEDPIDAFFAPGDDAFADMNKKLNQQSDSEDAPAESGGAQN